MKDGWREPQLRVWDNLIIAEAFTEMAREGGTPEIPQRWCVNIVANGLRAAVEIFNHRVAGKQEKLGTGTRSWFKEHELLVYQVRNGASHFSHRHGVGYTVSIREGIQTKPSPFVWIGDPEGEHTEIPMEEVLSRLSAVQSL